MTDQSNADAGRALEGRPNAGADTGVVLERLVRLPSLLREHRRKASMIIEYRTTRADVVDAVRALDEAADEIDRLRSMLARALPSVQWEVKTLALHAQAEERQVCEQLVMEIAAHLGLPNVGSEPRREDAAPKT